MPEWLKKHCENRTAVDVIGKLCVKKRMEYSNLLGADCQRSAMSCRYCAVDGEFSMKSRIWGLKVKDRLMSR
jgi:hypothetical protein